VKAQHSLLGVNAMQESFPSVLEGRRRKTSSAQAQEIVPNLAVPSEVFLGYRLWRVHYLWHRHLEQRLKALGLTRTQYLLLVATYHLINKGEVPSQIRLSNFTLVEKMVVSKTLRVLERRGYPSRNPTPRDRRANRLQITPTGAELLQKAFAVSLEAHTKFFEILGEDRKRIDFMLDELIRSNSD
jgi:DNA-binding MarR family transcriptional regulator